jgi:hypothetical protein
MNCKICSSTSTSFATAKVLRKYDVQYYACENCGFIQTEDPTWLDEAYTEPIAMTDIGLISRNLTLSRKTAIIISMMFNPDAAFLDHGGGNGMFVRLMRDRGFDFYWQDIHTQNMFAKGFEKPDDKTFELLTTFEVFEHLVNPLDEISNMLKDSQSILFSTLLVPNPRPQPEDWWYYSLSAGQHISLYTKRSLEIIAGKFNLSLLTDGSSFHLLTNKKVSPKIFKLILNTKIQWILSSAVICRKSLLADDYYRISGQKI